MLNDKIIDILNEIKNRTSTLFILFSSFLPKKNPCSFLFPLLFLSFNSASQEITIDLANIDLRADSIYYLSPHEAWSFAETDLDDPSLIPPGSWKQQNLQYFKKSMLDAEGNLEGWFRTSLSVPKSFPEDSLYFIVENTGQAIEFYVNGIYQGKLGDFGNHNGNYVRSSFSNKFLYSIEPIRPGATYTILIRYHHLALSGLSSYLYRAHQLSIGFYIANKSYAGTYMSNYENAQRVGPYPFTVNITVTLLFWLLYILGRREKFIVSIAVFMTAVTFAILPPYDHLEFEKWILVDALSNISFALVLGALVYVVAVIFSKKDPDWRKIIIPYFVLGVIEFQFVRYEVFGLGLLSSTLLLIVYYIIRARKRIKGSPWIVVAGLSIFILMVIGSFILLINNLFLQKYFYTNIFVIPITFLVYIVWRFREILDEVKSKADDLVRITEEKRVQTERQNEILEERVQERTQELHESLESLKATQTQLIHSEKMASLGELTAGIAHEIQNPLNFVNNFSEVNSELLDELEEEVAKGDLAEIKTIASDLKGNMSKITEHGKRADSIVKGMLMHSRNSKGEKVLADLNSLCDEYLRLSYHGMRAKHRNFNVDFQKDFDPALPKVKIVPQDIGRVLLNIFNNAFQSFKKGEGQSGLSPNVIVTTKNLGDKIEITISDNGPGIPEEIKDKIFQPFFTTKATGEGTGLGLSLSYDIVKAHGGEINLDSKKGIGSSFTIILPL